MISLFLIFSLLFIPTAGDYAPTWESLDTRPLPDWYDEAKLGIMIHWGVYTVPGFSTENTWLTWRENQSESLTDAIEKLYPKGTTYQDMAKDFTAELFNPHKWAKIIHLSGAKYVVLTSKHHDGFTLWPSTYTFSWNSKDLGPHRDLVGELKDALQMYGDVKFGLYYSLLEWYHPLYLADKEANFSDLGSFKFVENKIIPEMVELVERYQPEVLWAGGGTEVHSDYWKSAVFLSWLYNDSPVSKSVVVNDHWGSDSWCKHGSFLTCKFNPGTLQNKKWENLMSIDQLSRGYRRTASLSHYLSIKDIIGNLTSTVSCGGNLLLNIGATKEGIIPPIFEERLHQIGSWMKINGEAIYKSKPWVVCQNDTMTSGVWYTTNKEETIVYAMFSSWPSDNVVELMCPSFTTRTRVELLGVNIILSIVISRDTVAVHVPNRAEVTSHWAWTLRMTGVKNVRGHRLL